MDISPRQQGRGSGSTCAAAETERQNGRLTVRQDDNMSNYICEFVGLNWLWLWQDEVRLGLTVTQRQLLHSSADEVVSFICRKNESRNISWSVQKEDRLQKEEK
ncbi:hypothetical protein HAX54_005670 [Datura stramonium]|uniref:Uncharacterized protein n=1 Tax=Datura stramonium TaxID=4076 RepID=A0ABS8T9X6_DATST|nr:hypothetical protein [Datura stramonium]